MLDVLPRQRALPHSEESERAVLAALLLDYRLLPDVVSRLRPEDFYLERHQHLYQAMLDVTAAGSPVDLLTLQARMEQQATFDGAGGIAYLAGLDVDLPDVGRLDVYVAVVRERSTRRRVIQVAAETMRDCLDGGLEATPALDKALGALDALRDTSASGGYRSPFETHQATLQQLEEAEPGTIDGAKTGIVPLDMKLLAMQAPQLWFLGARPGVGKTAFLAQVADWNAAHGRTVGFVSIEMSREELQLRRIARETAIPFAYLRTNALGVQEWQRIHEVTPTLNSRPLWIDDGGEQTVEEITARARKLHREHPLGLLIVDYIGLVVPDAQAESRNEQVSRICKGLVRLAKALKVPVLAAVQLSRAGEKAQRPPILPDLRDSGAQEQDAYGVVFLHREHDPDQPAILLPHGSAIVAKNRGGECGSIPLLFEGSRMRFRAVDTYHTNKKEGS